MIKKITLERRLDIMSFFKSVTISDCLQFFAILITLIFSIISFVQSILSKKESKRATEIANDSLMEAQKSNMPAIIFCDEIKATMKTRYELCNEITFDFSDSLLDMGENSIEGLGQDDKRMCITAKIKNIGGGVSTGITISNFFIQNGNKITLNENAQFEADCLTLIENTDCLESFILQPQEELNINLIITDHVIEKLMVEGEDCDKKATEERIEKFINETDNFYVSMNLNIRSINNFRYNQDSLCATYLGGNIVYNSFDTLYRITK